MCLLIIRYEKIFNWSRTESASLFYWPFDREFRNGGRVYDLQGITDNHSTENVSFGPGIDMLTEPLSTSRAEGPTHQTRGQRLAVELIYRSEANKTNKS